MRNKKKDTLFILLLVLMAVTIGYAAISTTLKINGTTGIGKNTWNIYWDNIDNEQGVTPDEETTIVASNGVPKSLVTWSVTFDKPGDYYEFTVDAVNDGTMDAEIVGIESLYGNSPIISTSQDGELVVANPSPVPSYINYSIKYLDNTDPALGDRLAKATVSGNTITGTRKTYKIKVEYDKSKITNAILNEMEGPLELTFSFSVTYGIAGPPKAESFANDPLPVVSVEGNTSAEQTTTDGTCGAYNIGDERTITMDMDGNGTDETYTVRIANCSTPAICKTEGFSQTACGFVLEFKEIVTKHRIAAGVEHPTLGNYVYGGWKYSDMRAYLNNGTFTNSASSNPENINYSSTGFLSKMPEEFQELIANTTVVSGHGCIQSEGGVCTNPDNAGNNFTTTDKLYLLSAGEIWGSGGVNKQVEHDSALNNSRQLDYYALLGVTPDVGTYAPATKRLDGIPKVWWTRTPYDNDYTIYYDVGDVGIWYNNGPQFQSGVSPAFKLQ